MIDFKSLTDVLAHVEEVCVIDLLDHAMTIGEDCQKALVPAPKGLYLVGSMDPVLYEGVTYYAKSDVVVNGDVYDFANSQPIKDLSKLIKKPDDVYDATGKLVITKKQLMARSRFLKTESTLPVVGMKMAMAVVKKYLSTLCRHTSYIHDQARIRELIKPEFLDQYDTEEFMDNFTRLLGQLDTFIGNDYWNMYWFKMQGTSMVVLKGVDWRVYRYYQMTLPESDPDEE